MQTDILVDRFRRARIGDFTFATIGPSQGTRCSTMVLNNLPARWTAPEVLNVEGPLSKESDVFSFAMVMYEVSQRVQHKNLRPISLPFHLRSSLARFHSKVFRTLRRS